ncbi:DNA repair protein endonuclease SAE2/CtIP C-terminus-domain-containing protein [Daedaleopsis nitida]|nr:DNA repair protein endonuclease SAE2/CtIP C-terminus-domain-containing protein [Daedaleopsis nitida]
MLQGLLKRDTTHPQTSKFSFSRTKYAPSSSLNKLRWVNDDLHKQVFDAVQRGHRLAMKVGYRDLEDAERALATQLCQGSEEQQSQLEQLSEHPSEELAGHVQALQAELVSHVQLSKATLGALGDALEEVARMREENESLKEELEEANSRSVATVVEEEAVELAYARAELAALKQKYLDLSKAKKEADEKHQSDYKLWKFFGKWYKTDKKRRDEHKDGRAAKRRKLDLRGDDDEKKEVDGEHRTPQKGQRKRKADRKTSPKSSKKDLARSPSPCPVVLTSKSLNSSLTKSPTSSKQTSSPPLLTPPKSTAKNPMPHRIVSCNSTAKIPEATGNLPSSSDTEFDSQPVTFVYPSQHDVVEGSSAVVPQKRPRSPGPDSSETEIESQTPEFVLPSQIVPLTPAQAVDLTPKLRPITHRSEQLCTPVSLARPQQQAKGRSRAADAIIMPPPVASPSRSNRFRPPPLAAKTRPLPALAISSPTSKGKERAVQNDENAPMSTNPGHASKKGPTDYSIYKGRGRYGAEARAGKETINAMYEINPERNHGVGFQYEEVVRDKNKRKHMHAGDCECCRDYYEAVGPLPSRLQPPAWRSPESSPSKRRKGKRTRDSFEDDDEDKGEIEIEAHKNAISRHRQHWARAATPPGYWNIGFPDTQEVAQMNAEARRMHERKRALVAVEAERGGKYRKR